MKKKEKKNCGSNKDSQAVEETAPLPQKPPSRESHKKKREKIVFILEEEDESTVPKKGFRGPEYSEKPRESLEGGNAETEKRKKRA